MAFPNEISVATKEKQDEILNKLKNGAMKRNIVFFDTPGTYQWMCPEGVEVVHLTMFAGGGSGAIVRNGASLLALGGGGGSYVDNKPIKVVPGTTYSLVVGAGGAGVVITDSTNFTEGNAGGSSSAFGILCVGGLKGKAPNALNDHLTKRPAGNSPLCNRGTTYSLIQKLDQIQTYSDSAVTSSTRFGIGGIFMMPATGGGAGFGDGGDSNDHINPVALGAGSGGSLRVNVSDPPTYTAKGGDGIIIIEY